MNYHITLTVGYILSLEFEFALETIFYKTKFFLQRNSQCSIFCSNFKTELQKKFYFFYLYLFMLFTTAPVSKWYINMLYFLGDRAVSQSLFVSYLHVYRFHFLIAFI